ncbi:MAG: HD domain-containing protein [Clostridia bacterium]|nr:HD domain-containing protein [Clostridia bacterium]
MEQKIRNLLQFYLLATELKNKIRSGWKVWNIERERIESVAEHIYGTCILAISIDSQFELGIDLYKVVMMLVLHEIEEIKIGDLTPFDKQTKEERRTLGKQAVEEVLGILDKKVEYIELIEEFEEMQTKESLFAKMCDKLEADIQSKIYCEEGSLDIQKAENQYLLKDTRIQKLLEEGAKSISDLFVENDKPIFTEKVFENIADYVKENELLQLKNRKY